MDDIFISSYDNDKTITYGKIDIEGKIEKIYEEKLVNFPSYIKRFNDYLYVAQKKDKDEKLLGILEYKILKDKLKMSRLYESKASFTHLYINEKYIIGASYHQGLIQVFEKNTNNNFIYEIPDSKIHNVGYIDIIDKYYAVNLAGNCIYLFEIKDSSLNIVKTIDMEKNDMPRHLWCFKNSEFIYVLTENSSKIKAYNIKDNYRLIQEIDTIKERVKNNPAAIMADEDQKYIFISNRGKDNIVVFKILENSGKLEYWYEIDYPIKDPRDFYLRKDIIYIASQGTNQVLVVKLNNEKKEHKIIQELKIDKPVCIEL